MVSKITYQWNATDIYLPKNYGSYDEKKQVEAVKNIETFLNANDLEGEMESDETTLEWLERVSNEVDTLICEVSTEQQQDSDRGDNLETEILGMTDAGQKVMKTMIPAKVSANKEETQMKRKKSREPKTITVTNLATGKSVTCKSNTLPRETEVGPYCYFKVNCIGMAILQHNNLPILETKDLIDEVKKTYNLPDSAFGSIDEFKTAESRTKWKVEIDGAEYNPPIREVKSPPIARVEPPTKPVTTMIPTIEPMPQITMPRTQEMVAPAIVRANTSTEPGLTKEQKDDYNIKLALKLLEKHPESVVKDAIRQKYGANAENMWSNILAYRKYETDVEKLMPETPEFSAPIVQPVQQPQQMTAPMPQYQAATPNLDFGF